MNKNLWWMVGAGILGFGLGAITTRLYFQKKYNQLYEKEREELLVHISKKESLIEVPDEVKEKNSHEDEAYATIIAHNGYRAYNKILKTEEREESEESKEPDESEESEEIQASVYSITWEQYYDTTPDDQMPYDKVELTWYAVDGVLSRDNDEIIERPVDILGEEVEVLFDAAPVTEVYIRNERDRIDYEISYLDSAYQVVILGVDPGSLT